MYCKHLAEMDPLQPGDEVEMAELTTGKFESFCSSGCCANQSAAYYFSNNEGILCIRSHLIFSFCTCDLGHL